MINRFERLRKKLDAEIEKNGLNSRKTEILSDKFNKILNNYYLKERKFKEGNVLEEKYKLSLEKLEKKTKKSKKFPSIEEWNKYAKENDLLSSESIKYISGINWHELRIRILSEIHK